jgi:hypothetical protein
MSDDLPFPDNLTSNDLPLPDDLRVLALEYKLKRELSEDENDALFLTLDEISAGYGQPISEGQKSLFGESYDSRGRVNIVASQLMIDRWSEKNCRMFRCYGASARLNGWRVLENFPIDDDYCEFYIFKDRAEFVALMRELTRDDADLVRFLQLKEACNGDFVEVGRILRELEAEKCIAPAPEFLVAGLIPKGCVTLLLGAKAVGKGALLLELACDVAQCKQTWQGFELNPGSGFVVYLFGEDPAQEMRRRVQLLCDGARPGLLQLTAYNGRDVREILDYLENIKVSLLVVDPARKFFHGDEDGSDAVSEFFTAIETFARKKDCAVVAAHHLKRGSTPKTIHDVASCMRGSQVFLDRPRVVLGMIRTGQQTQFGIVAPNGQPMHNLDTNVMTQKVLRLRRNAATFRHVPYDSPQVVSATEIDRVHSALIRLSAEGRRLTHTNLFQIAPPEIEGMSRSAVQKALGQLEAAGVVKQTSDASLDIHGDNRS